MNNHERYEELIVPYLYGELSEADEQLMREHVKQCRFCADEVADFERIREGMQREPAPVLSASARRRIVKRAARELKPAWSLFWGIPELAVAATLLIAVFAGVFYVRHRSEMTAEIPGRVMEQVEAPAVPEPRAVPTPARDEAFADRRDKMLTPDELKSRRRQDEPAETRQEKGTTATLGKAEPSAATPPPPAPAVGFSATNEVPSSEKDQEANANAPSRLSDTQAEKEQGVTFATPPPASLERAASQQQVGQDQIQLQSTTVPMQSAKEKKAEGGGTKVGGRETFSTVRPVGGAPSFEEELAAAADLEAKGKRQEAAAAYRALIERFPAREKEILKSIKDQSVRQRLQPK